MLFEDGEVWAAAVAKFDVFELMPEAGIERVELWCVGRERLDEKVASCFSVQERAHLSSVNRRAVPDYHYSGSEMPTQCLQETHTIGTGERSSAHQSVKAACECEPSHDREVCAATEGMQDGSLSAGRIGTHHSGKQPQATFIDKYYLPTFPIRLFLSAGHRLVRHCSMISSSR